jgi:hypothetical protein
MRLFSRINIYVAVGNIFFMQSLLLIFVLYLLHMLPFCMQEVGHFLAAFPKNVKLGIPFFIPNFTLRTFGAVTQVSIP